MGFGKKEGFYLLCILLLLPSLASAYTFIYNYAPEFSVQHTSPIVANQPILWNYSLQDNYFAYTTPPITVNRTFTNTSQFWITVIDVSTNFSGVYADVVIYQKVPTDFNISIAPHFPFNTFSNDSGIYAVVGIPELNKSTQFSLVGVYDIKPSELEQLPAQAGKPVQWRQRVLANATNNTFNLPAGVSNLNATVLDGFVNLTAATVFIQNQTLSVDEFNRQSYQTQLHRRLGNLKKLKQEHNTESLNRYINEIEERLPQRKGFFQQFTEPEFVEGNATLTLVDVPDDSVIELIYETPAPEVVEEQISETRKQVTITSEYHYQNISVTTHISETPQSAITLYWLQNNSRTQVTDISYFDTNNDSLVDMIEWEVPHLSNQTYEIDISILNVQSYPEVGGLWQVLFNTTGTANLTIQAVNDTTWSLAESTDLKFLNVSCGDTLVVNEWTNSSVFVQDYSCNSTSVETSRVLTKGVHILAFTFGNITQYARNFASDPIENVSQIYDTTFTQALSTTAVAVNLDSSTIVNSGFSHNAVGFPTRLYFNATDNYRISYSCGVRNLAANTRNLMAGYLRINGSTEIVPSRSICYTRQNATQGNRCSVQGAIIAEVSNGGYVELMMDQIGGTTGTNTSEDCFVNAVRVKTPVAQVYSTATQNVNDVQETIINFTTTTIADQEAFVVNLSNDFVRVTRDGWYKIFYQTCVISDPQTSRSNPNTWLRKNGVNITQSHTYYYLKNANAAGDRNCAMGILLQELNVNDTISMGVRKKVSEANSINSTTFSNNVWMTLEKVQSDDVFYAYANADGASHSSVTPVDYDTQVNVGGSFSHTPGGSQITFDRGGLYEVAYTYSWDDGGSGGRRVVCGFLRLDGSTTVSPSRQCDFSRGDPDGSRFGTVSANVIVDVNPGQFIELLSDPNTAVSPSGNASWITITPLQLPNADSPQFSDAASNNTIIGADDLARFSINVTDTNHSIHEVNGTINGTNYLFNQGSGNQWYFDYLCTDTTNPVNFTYVVAADDFILPNTNSTTITGVGVECDAVAPNITEARINDTSLVLINTTVKVNASVTDPEGNLYEVLLEVTPPGVASYNVTVGQNGNEFFNDTILLDKGGRWNFSWFANDTGGNILNQIISQDLNDNFFIEVDASSDSDVPFFDNFSVNDTLFAFGEFARFQVDVNDFSSGISAVNGTVNNTLQSFIQGAGTTWYYDFNCTYSNTNVSFTFVSANDSAGNLNSTFISNVFSVCDTNAPNIGNASINDSSVVAFNAHILVNASIFDDLNNTNTTILQISPPLTAAYNTTLVQNGTEYYNASIVLDQTGRWNFTFFANDSAGNMATPVAATDEAANSYIEVADPFVPNVTLVSPVAGSHEFVSDNVSLSVNISDNYLLSATIVNVTHENGTTQTFTLTQTIDDTFEYIFVPMYPGYYNVTFFANDTSGNVNNSQTSQFVAFDRAEDVAMAPLTTSTYAYVWADVNRIFLEIRHTNGSTIQDRILVDETASDVSRVDAVAIDSSSFVVGWVDGADEDLTIAKYDSSLNLQNGPTDLDTQLASIETEDRSDISLTVLNTSLLGVAWLDDDEQDYDFNLWDVALWFGSGEYAVETSIGDDAIRQNQISASAINDSRIFHIWFDENGGFNISIEISDGSTDLTDFNRQLAISDNVLSKVASTPQRASQIAYAYFNDLTDTVEIGVDNYSTGTRVIVQPPTVIDAAASTTYGLAMAEMDVNSSSFFVVVYNDGNDGSIFASVFNQSGSMVTAPFVVESSPSTTYGLVDVISSQSRQGVRICPETFVVSYTNSSGVAQSAAFYLNGTVWDGVCIDSNPPITTLDFPAPNLQNDSFSYTNLTFGCSAIDSFELQNVSFYITNYTNDSLSFNQSSTLSGTSDNAQWNATLHAGNYTWNCLTYDTSGNRDWGENRTLQLNYSNQAPFWSTNQSNIVTTYNDSIESLFNITWKDDFGINTTLFESNFTGSDQNFSMVEDVNDVFNFSSIFPAGTFYWESYANDSVGRTNKSDNVVFIIDKATTILTIENNDTFTVPNGTTTNVSCIANNPEVNFTLYRNDTFVNWSVDGVIWDVQQYSNAAVVPYICNTTGSQNYTSVNTTKTLIVTENNVSACSLSFIPSNPATYPAQINATCNCSNTQAPAYMFRNGTNITNEIGLNVTLGAGTYGYVCNVTQTANWTAATNTTDFVLQRASPNISLVINSTAADFIQNVSFFANLSCSLFEPAGENVNLTRNGTVIDTGIGPHVNISRFVVPFDYEIMCEYSTQNDNYTSASITYFVNATDTEPPDVFALVPTAGTAFAVSESFEIAANLSDNYLIDTVLVNITLPNGSITQLELTNSSGAAKFNESYQTLLPGVYLLTFIVNDSLGNVNMTEQTNFTTTDFSEDVAVSSIDATRFAVLWQNTREVLLEVFNTDTTTNMTRVIVDTNGGDIARVDIQTVNSTHLMLEWVDSENGIVKIALYNMYNDTLQIVRAPTNVQTGITVNNNDVSLTIMSDELAGVGWVNDQNNDYEFILWNHQMWSGASSQFFLDANIAPDTPRQNFISNVAYNTSHISHVWFDENGGFNISGMVTDGTQADTAYRIATADGVASKVSSTLLQDQRIAYGLFNDLANDIVVRVDEFATTTPTPVLPNQVIEANPGTPGGITSTTINRGNSSFFVVVWHDATDGNIQGSLHDENGAQLLEPFVLSTTPSGSATLRLMDVAGANILRGSALCDDTFALAYTNSSTLLDIQTFYANGTAWNGVCTQTTFADLIISDITITGPQNARDTNVTINVNVSNIGFANATNLTVHLNISFYNGTFNINETQTSYLLNVSAQDSTIVAFSWIAETGLYDIRAKVDFDNTVMEQNEINNELNINYSVPAWSIYYGSYNISSILGDSGTNIFQEWAVLSEVGNSYYYDTDAAFDVDDLAGISGTNDLSEADAALRMQFYNDSIEQLFDTNNNGVADTQKNISTGTGSILNVPIILTTNSSAFITGIAYDTADGVGYDGSQDLVVITQINESQTGGFGIQDYEVRVPFTLGNLTPSTNLVARLDEFI